MMYISLLGMEDAIKADEKSDVYLDLNLDLIIQKIVYGKHKNQLKDLFFTPLHNVGTIRYRQDIFRDLMNRELYGGIESFTSAKEVLEDNMGFLGKIVNQSQKEAYFLNCVCFYCNMIQKLMNVFEQAPLRSEGLLGMKGCLKEYLGSKDYMEMVRTANTLKTEMLSTGFHLKFTDDCVYIGKYREENELSGKLEKLLYRFKETQEKHNYCRKRTAAIFNMNSLEEKILEAEKETIPEIFLSISLFIKKWNNFQPEFVKAFYKEIEFFMSYLHFIDPLREKGYQFNFPGFCTTPQDCCIQEGFDLLLAYKHMDDDNEVVTNSIESSKEGFIFVVTGPNQGGKTTFARMFGQVNYLALLGAPVPGRRSCLFPRDNIFTHFEHEEIAYNDNGKLQDDLKRIHDKLEAATERSMIIINEMLSSTTYQDAVKLGRKIIKMIEERNILCLYVTFVNELANMEGRVVSLTSVVDMEKYGLRTYKILPQKADGNAYARTIAEKYNLSYDKIIEKIIRNERSKMI